MATSAQAVYVEQSLQAGSTITDINIWSEDCSEDNCLVVNSGNNVLFRIKLTDEDIRLLRLQLITKTEREEYDAFLAKQCGKEMHS